MKKYLLILITLLLILSCSNRKKITSFTITKVKTIKPSTDNFQDLIFGSVKIIDNEMLLVDPRAATGLVYDVESMELIKSIGQKGTRESDLRMPITMNKGIDGNYYFIENMFGYKSYDENGNFIELVRHTQSTNCFNTKDSTYVITAGFFPKANLINISNSKNDTIFYGDYLTNYLTGTRARLNNVFTSENDIYLAMIGNMNVFKLNDSGLEVVKYEEPEHKYKPGNYAPFARFKDGWLRLYVSINQDPEAPKSEKADPRLCYYSDDFDILATFELPVDEFILTSFLGVYGNHIFLHNPGTGEVTKYKVEIN